MKNPPSWLPSLPVNWRWENLQSVLSNVVDNRGKTVPTSDSGIPLIATNCIKSEKLYPVYENVRYVSDEIFQNWFRSHPLPDDVIFVNKGTPGLVCLIPDPVDFCIAQDMVALRSDPCIMDNKFLYACLDSHIFQSQVKNTSVGTMIPHLKKSDFVNLWLPVPPIKESSEIGNLIFNIDYYSHHSNRIINSISDLISALFRSWFIDFDPVKSKVEGKLPYGMDEETVALFPDSFEDSEIGPIPAGWRVGTVSEFGKIVTGRTPSSKNPEHFDGTIPFITIPDLGRNIWQDETERTISQAGAEALKSAVIPADSVCVSCIATVGNVGITTRPSITNQQIHSIVCDKGYSSLFVYSLMTSFVQNLKFFAGGGAVVQNISKSMFGKQRVIIPPIQAVEQFTKLVEHLYQDLHALNSTSRILIATRDTLLPRLMSGELSVS